MKDFGLKENRTHGSREFPVEYYYVDNSHPRYQMAPHWHEEFEIIRVLKGTFHVWLENNPFTLREGDMLLVNCDTLHRGDPEDCIYECLVFDLNMLRKNGTSNMEDYIFPFFHHSVSVIPFIDKEDKDCEEIRSIICDVMQTASEKKEYYELKVNAFLYAIVHEIYSKNFLAPAPKQERASRQMQTIMNLLSWIEDNFRDSITLSDMAKLTDISEKYLCRFFKKYTGKTPIEYIIDLRLETACNMMTFEGKSVTEAAFSVGFSDLSYFSKLFKAKKGMTPGQYKKTCR